MAIRVLLTLTVLVALTCAASADITTYSLNNNGEYNIGPGYVFTYDSYAESPGYDPLTSTTYTDWLYSYYLENLSTEHDILSWSCDIPFVNENLKLLNTPLTASDGANTSFDQVQFSHPSGIGKIDSVVTWDDGTKTHIPIYAIPEPTSIIAFAVGLAGLLGLRRKSRIR